MGRRRRCPQWSCARGPPIVENMRSEKKILFIPNIRQNKTYIADGIIVHAVEDSGTQKRTEILAQHVDGDLDDKENKD